MIRRKTRAVDVGGVKIGGENPIVIQSMTNTSTSDVESTVAQIKRLAAAAASWPESLCRTEKLLVA